MKSTNSQSKVLAIYALLILLHPNLVSALDNFNPDVTSLPVVSTAKSSTTQGDYKALSPLQKEADASGGAMPLHYTGPTSPSLSEYKGETADDIARRAEANAQIEAELAATPVADAFKESFGGSLRNIKSNTDDSKLLKVDDSYKPAEYRQEFRSVYDMEDWNDLERTTNKEQYDDLVSRLNEKARLKAIADKSPLGHVLGRLFDPILIALALLSIWFIRRKKKTS